MLAEYATTHTRPGWIRDFNVKYSGLQSYQQKTLQSDFLENYIPTYLPSFFFLIMSFIKYGLTSLNFFRFVSFVYGYFHFIKKDLQRIFFWTMHTAHSIWKYPHPRQLSAIYFVKIFKISFILWAFETKVQRVSGTFVISWLWCGVYMLFNEMLDWAASPIICKSCVTCHIIFVLFL